MLEEALQAVLPLDGLVLSLHGALVAADADSGDLALLRRARSALGPGPPIGVCLDLHAHPVDELIAESAFVIGYRTYPHVDQAETGARAARLLLELLGRPPAEHGRGPAGDAHGSRGARRRGARSGGFAAMPTSSLLRRPEWPTSRCSRRSRGSTCPASASRSP